MNTIIESWIVLVPLLVLYIVFAAVLIVRKHFSLFQFITLISFGVYLAAVLHLVLFPIQIGANEAPWYTSVNFIPIVTIDLFTFLLNIVMLAPFGVYLYLFTKNLKSWKQALVYGLLFSFSLELTQIVLKILFDTGRSADINDLLANAFGTVFGFVLFKRLASFKTFSRVVSKFVIPARGLN